MPGSLGPRFALEAGFLILLAVVLGFADLSPLLIILIMGLAWVLVSLIEYFAWRQGPRFPTRYAALGPVMEQESVIVEEPMGAVPPPPAPAAAPAPPPPEEQTVVAPAAAAASSPEAGSAEESIEQADQRVDAARLAFHEEVQRTRHRLEPLQPRPRRRFGLFGPRERRESSREEER